MYLLCSFPFLELYFFFKWMLFFENFFSENVFVVSIFIIQSIFRYLSRYNSVVVDSSFDLGIYVFSHCCTLFLGNMILSPYMSSYFSTFIFFPSLIQRLFHGSRNFSRRAPIHLLPDVLMLWNSHWTLYLHRSTPRKRKRKL